jgi:hypothetical protein
VSRWDQERPRGLRWGPCLVKRIRLSSRWDKRKLLRQNKELKGIVLIKCQTTQVMRNLGNLILCNQSSSCEKIEEGKWWARINNVFSF